MTILTMFVRKYLSSLSTTCRVQYNLKKYGRISQFSTHKMDKDIVWVDLEMTGLDIDKDKIIEVACLITDSNLQIKSPSFHTIIHQTDELMNNMNEWCTRTHKETGLTDLVRKSNVTLADAEEQLLNFIRKYIKNEKTCPMAGNSIYIDRLFIRKQMPKVDDYLHYHVIDVSSIKELARRWYPDIINNVPRKMNTHRAVDDIKESIDELNFYRKNLFKN